MILERQLQWILVNAERFAPELTARAWGVLHDPFSQLQGLQVSKLSGTQAEVKFRNSDGFPSRFIQAGERAIDLVWKRHLTPGLERVTLKNCQFELLQESFEENLFARTELLKSDREKILAEGSESLVLYYDSQNRLVARALYKVNIKSLLPIGIAGGKQ